MVLLAGGALLIATPGMTANTFATGPNATGLTRPDCNSSCRRKRQSNARAWRPEHCGRRAPSCQVPMTFQTIRFCRRTRPAELLRQISAA